MQNQCEVRQRTPYQDVVSEKGGFVTDGMVRLSSVKVSL
jgi:hypothetical protein